MKRQDYEDIKKLWMSSGIGDVTESSSFGFMHLMMKVASQEPRIHGDAVSILDDARRAADRGQVYMVVHLERGKASIAINIARDLDEQDTVTK